MCKASWRTAAPSATDRGWVIGEEYVDNDISAYSGRPIPAYARMVADLKAGSRDGLIV